MKKDMLDILGFKSKSLESNEEIAPVPDLTPELQQEVQEVVTAAPKAISLQDLNAEQVVNVAKHVHNALAYFALSIGETCDEWNSASEDKKQSTLDGVKKIIADPSITPEQIHDNWVAYKEQAGWVYGPEKNEETKEHPCLVPFSELTDNEKRKDEIFVTVTKKTLSDTTNTVVGDGGDFNATTVTNEVVALECECEKLQAISSIADAIEIAPQEQMNETNSEILKTAIESLGLGSHLVLSKEAFAPASRKIAVEFSAQKVQESAKKIYESLIEIIKRLIARVYQFIQEARTKFTYRRAKLMALRRLVEDSKAKEKNHTTTTTLTGRILNGTCPARISSGIADFSKTHIDMHEVFVRFSLMTTELTSVINQNAQTGSTDLTDNKDFYKKIQNSLSNITAEFKSPAYKGSKAAIVNPKGLAWLEGGLVFSSKAPRFAKAEIDHSESLDVKTLTYNDALVILSKLEAFNDMIDKRIMALQSVVKQLQTIKSDFEMYSRSATFGNRIPVDDLPPGKRRDNVERAVAGSKVAGEMVSALVGSISFIETVNARVNNTAFYLVNDSIRVWDGKATHSSTLAAA